MNKRRRTSSVSSRSIDEDQAEPEYQSPMTEPTTRKKRKLDPLDIIQNLYDTIRNHKKPDGSLLCEDFIRAPNRRQEPGYHDVVSNPIDLLKIQQKVKTDEYEDVDDMQADMELLVNNAKSFYQSESQECEDANELWELFLKTKNRLLEPPVEEAVTEVKEEVKVRKRGRPRKYDIVPKKNETTPKKSEPVSKKQPVAVEPLDIEENSSESFITFSNDDEVNLSEELFTAVMNAYDGDRPLFEVFQLLPSRKRYPEYYDIIENPIDLRTIARRVQKGRYASLSDMESDLLLMTKNACMFNEPGSQIYKDAKMLKRIILTRKAEIEQGKCSLEKKSERTRNKRLRGSLQSLSAITAALHSENDDSDFDDDLDDGDDCESDDPRWQLYDTVRTFTDAEGVCVADSFLKLPSKRYEPMYYKEIKNPLSILQIRKKLINGYYDTVSEIAGDLNTLCENAKKTNKPESKLYKDAMKLQKIMQTKVQELLDFQYQCSESEEDSNDESCAKRFKTSDPLKKRLYSVCKCLLDYETEDGRQPMLLFMEKPSRKLYPDYYQVIHEPMDMLTIESNIRADKYASEEELLSDFKLMFRNCREYNEEDSSIYKDALILEKVLIDHVRELGLTVEESPIISTSIKIEMPDALVEDSNDCGAPSVCSSDIGAPSTPSNFVAMNITTPSTTKKKRGGGGTNEPREPKAKQVSGYILYSCDTRKTVTANNPNISFGEVSRIVGTEWKKLTAHEKNVWEEKAARMNEEAIARFERGETTPAPPPPTPSSTPRTYVPPIKLPDQVWECQWENCDYMFEDQLDCLDHAVADQKGHVSSWFASNPNRQNGEYQCQWRNCARIKKESPPFPSLHRLIRHVKEVHIMKNAGRVVPPCERGEVNTSVKNFIPSTRKPPPPPPTPPSVTPSSTALTITAKDISNNDYGEDDSVPETETHTLDNDDAHFVPTKRNLNNTGVQTTTASTTTTTTTLTVLSTAAALSQGTTAVTSTIQSARDTQSPKSLAASAPSERSVADPLFVVVPPRPNRVLHSVIYLRYIENLSAERPAQVSSWENQLYASVDSVPSPDPKKLPTQWLENGVGNHGSELNALWALRDYMMQDALNLSRTNTMPN